MDNFTLELIGAFLLGSITGMIIMGIVALIACKAGIKKAFKEIRNDR